MTHYLLPMSPSSPSPRPNVLWTVAGIAALGCGILGIVLPILPTTPLVLLAAYCFSKGSPRLQVWLLGHPRFGPMISDWRKNGAIHPRAKRMAALAMLAAFGLSLAMGLPIWVLTVQALCLGGAATFVLTRPDAG
ncbi:MAG: YbaN family protein [Aliishimia sp.]